MTTSSLVIFGFLNELQNYLQEEPFTFQPYLLNTEITISSTTYKKCYYYDNNLELSPSILKRVSKTKNETFFAILYRRTIVKPSSMRKFDIRAFSTDYIAQLVKSGLLPQDYTGEYREVSLTLELKPETNNLEYQFEFNEYFTIDWVGNGTFQTSIQVNDEVEFSFTVGYKADVIENFEKPLSKNNFYQTTFQVELTFPLIKLNPKSNLIQTINKAIYTY